MGKVTGFLEIDRQERKYAPAADRVRHYNEFIIPLSDFCLLSELVTSSSLGRSFSCSARWYMTSR